MNVRNLIANDLVEKDGVYFVDESIKFAYNDGDLAETYLLRAIQGSSDVSSRSRELESHIKDWVSRYHLSRSRSLAYESLDIPENATVLEIGSGSGSITRHLGERGCSVLAIEGSPRRAAMTRSRTRDQENVAVVCATFGLIRFARQFDIIVCNGVLEYASMFMPGDDAARNMVGMFSDLLSPAGTLLIAIENKLGLRYFSSAREEHTGVEFDGLEGYARYPRGARTFGRLELDALLRKRFDCVEFLLPLPDYKFPRALISEKMLREVDCSELFSGMGSGTCDTQFRPLMHERLVWRQLGRNLQLENFANSFFVLAGHAPSRLLKPSWRGDIYAINRAPGIEVKTRISANSDGVISVKKSYIGGAARTPGAFQHHLEEGVWVEGESIHSIVMQAMLEKTSRPLEQRIGECVSRWWSAVTEKAGKLDEHGMAGTVLDLNWENSILRDDGIHFIDNEWSVDRTIPPSWVLYRTVGRFLDAEWSYRHRWNAQWRNASKRRFLNAIAGILGIHISVWTIWQSIRLEEEFQGFATESSRPKWRVLVEDCMPFWLAYHWKESGRRLRRFSARLWRNFRRLFPL